ncbi:hypothetical protein AVEN_97594-1, partial [Araneus ventricosus]
QRPSDPRWTKTIRSKMDKDHQIQDGQRPSDPRWTKTIRSKMDKDNQI